MSCSYLRRHCYFKSTFFKTKCPQTRTLWYLLVVCLSGPSSYECGTRVSCLLDQLVPGICSAFSENWVGNGEICKTQHTCKWRMLLHSESLQSDDDSALWYGIWRQSEPLAPVIMDWKFFQIERWCHHTFDRALSILGLEIFAHTSSRSWTIQARGDIFAWVAHYLHMMEFQG